MKLTRRKLLIGGGAAAGLAAAGKLGWELLAEATRAPYVREMALALRDVRADAAVEVAFGWIEAGVTREQLLATAFCAQVLSGADRGDPHAQLTPPSIASLCAAFPEAVEDGWLAALWAVQFSCEWLIDAEPPPPAPAGRGDLESAMRSDDAVAVDAAVVAAFGARGPHWVVRALAPWTTCALGDPHTPILLAQTQAGLRFLPDDLALPMLRSAGRRLCARAAVPGPGWEEDADAAALYAGRADRSERDGAIALDIVGLMAAGDDAVTLAQLPGFVEASSWRAPMIACVLAAAGIMPVASASSGMGVHSATLADALLTLGTVASPLDRALMGRRAVRWFSRLLAAHPGALWTEELRLKAPPSLDAIEGATDPVNTARAWFREGGQAPDYTHWLARRGLSPGQDPHDFKYAAALMATATLIPADARAATLSYTAASALATVKRDPWPGAQAARLRLRATLGQS